mmetsp:Transcript_21366/g.59226  ORF Transcript_21366/g.59226 Transcript_21366/m.59226 type:complete len:83 (+) Transcript_21366:20-268(+)
MAYFHLFGLVAYSGILLYGSLAETGSRCKVCAAVEMDLVAAILVVPATVPAAAAAVEELLAAALAAPRRANWAPWVRRACVK